MAHEGKDGGCRRAFEPSTTTEVERDRDLWRSHFQDKVDELRKVEGFLRVANKKIAELEAAPAKFPWQAEVSAPGSFFKETVITKEAIRECLLRIRSHWQEPSLNDLSADLARELNVRSMDWAEICRGLKEALAVANKKIAELEADFQEMQKSRDDFRIRWVYKKTMLGSYSVEDLNRLEKENAVLKANLQIWKTHAMQLEAWMHQNHLNNPFRLPSP